MKVASILLASLLFHLVHSQAHALDNKKGVGERPIGIEGFVQDRCAAEPRDPCGLEEPGPDMGQITSSVHGLAPTCSHTIADPILLEVTCTRFYSFALPRAPPSLS